MPANVPPLYGDRESLVAFLAQQRYWMEVTIHGLDDAGLRAVPSTSALSLGGLLKHLDFVENDWMDSVLLSSSSNDPSPYYDSFRLLDSDTAQFLLAAYRATAARTEHVMAGITDLEQPVPLSPAPWNPPGSPDVSVRWVLLHLIEETARHLGHADILRESLDGAQAYPLLAAVEGWEPTDWLRPWTRHGTGA